MLPCHIINALCKDSKKNFFLNRIYKVKKFDYAVQKTAPAVISMKFCFAIVAFERVFLKSLGLIAPRAPMFDGRNLYKLNETYGSCALNDIPTLVLSLF